MVETRIVVRHRVGLHARPAAVFVQTARRFNADMRVKNMTAGGEAVDAKSILGVLTLGVLQGHEIHITAEGEDAAQAVEGMRALVESNFGEAG
jgi:phosphotransferase system HPr (HPr) family protein